MRKQYEKISKKMMRLSVDNILLGLLVMIALFTGGILASVKVKADDTTVIDEITIMIPVACSMNSDDAAADPHTEELMPGEYKSDIGTTNIQVFCNDFAGFAVYAIGASSNTDGNTNLVGQTSSQTIPTGTDATGSVSNWAMKLIKVTNPASGDPIVYNPENLSIANGYDDYSVVPSTYTKVANFEAASGSGPATTDRTLGSKLQTTYAASASASQAADTYVGQVKYLLVHPATLVPGTYTLVYNGNGARSGSTPSETGIKNYETHTLKNNGYTAPNGYSFAGWCTIQDTSATTQNPQTTCKGVSYANQAVLPANPDASATSGGTFTLYAYWRKN